MSRALIALLAVCSASLAAAQSIEVASCRDCKTAPLSGRAPAQILIKAKCTFSDGTLVGYQSFVVDVRLSADEKRAAAERACEPVMQDASAKCDELANHVEALKSEWRVAPLHSIQERNLKGAIKQALASAPAYCKP
jgi:hypothetical protein